MPSRILLVSTLAITAADLGTLAAPPTPRLVWNASASAPLGLYVVVPDAPVLPGDMVVARAPASVRRFAAVRRYVPVNVPLVKRVVAVAGQQVCASGPFISVDARRVAVRRALDGRGRPLPWWRGCVVLKRGAVLLLMARADSFDGRYFGPTAAADILGRARLVWATSPHSLGR